MSARQRHMGLHDSVTTDLRCREAPLWTDVATFAGRPLYHQAIRTSIIGELSLSHSKRLYESSPG